MQSQLKTNLGVDLKIRSMPSRAFNKLINEPSTMPKLLMYSFGLDYPDPQEQHEYLAKSQPAGFANYANYSNEDFDELHIFLTHLHLDHVQGLGFFRPLFRPGANIHLWGPASPVQTLSERIAIYLSPRELGKLR